MKSHILPGGGKVYETELGLLPSVTTIIDLTRPPESARRLENWKKRVGEDKAEHIRANAAARGSVLHALLEAEMSRGSVECPQDLEPFWRGLRPVARAIRDPVAIEFSVIHKTLRYAGRLDLLAHWRGELTLFDLKTSEREKREEWMDDAKLQIAAYRGAYEEMFGTPINIGLILVASPSGTQIFEIERDELEELFDRWRERISQFRAEARDLLHCRWQPPNKRSLLVEHPTSLSSTPSECRSRRGAFLTLHRRMRNSDTSAASPGELSEALSR